MINYRSIASLNKDVLAWIGKLPRGIELVVGIPRSGLLVANLLSLHMNIPLTDVEGLINDRIIQTGVRYNGDKKEFLSSAKKILVVDDSVLRGTQMRAIRTKIEEAKIPHQVLYSAVYVKPGSQNMVDHFYELLSTPRFFEWNIMHTPIIKEFCIDIDGVLCRDPTKEENDDGPRYEEFIKSVRPIVIPSYRIGWLITCRLRKYRSITEEWLAKHNFQYQELVMMDFPTKEARIASGSYAKYKADIYQQSNAKLFIESSPMVATQIAELSGRPVLCAATREMLYPGFASKNYQRGKRFAKLLWRNPRVAFRRLVKFAGASHVRII